METLAEKIQHHRVAFVALSAFMLRVTDEPEAHEFIDKLEEYVTTKVNLILAMDRAHDEAS